MSQTERRRPNIVVIICDDLAYGDLACHGNPYTRTTHLDRLHAESIRFTRYCSGPLCTPARASLMTGRYPYRTRAIDTYIGRSMIDPEEVTLGEIYQAAGYRTGIFGKWHLGDNFPMRPCDMGFSESLVHRGGGIGQYGDIVGQSYFDPVLHRNGVPEQHLGYCTDIFAEATCNFVERFQNEPFFIYMATNAPHSPLEVSDHYINYYTQMGLNDKVARLYGMVDNIDWNVGRVLVQLSRLGLEDNTIVIFTSDHGPCGSVSVNGKVRWNADLRGQKGQMYEGGVKVPFFVRWPDGIPEAGRDVDRIANPIDILPTLTDATNLELPEEIKLDGTSLKPLLQDANAASAWPDRQIKMQWHRGDEPLRYRNYAVIGQQYKLYRPNDKAPDELYDLLADPSEKENIASRHADLVRDMRQDYDTWFDDVSSTREDNYAPPPIYIGTPYENPTTLTRQDWRVTHTVKTEGNVGWDPDDEGHWIVRVMVSGAFRVRLRFRSRSRGGTAILKVGNLKHTAAFLHGESHVTFDGVALRSGDGIVEAWVDVDGQRAGVTYVDFYQPLCDLESETLA